ncbi:MAG: hypothetical protein Q4E65_02560 [Clostridia bacterium]|nr:hypothetical protein [Clostridia bacterium]
MSTNYHASYDLTKGELRCEKCGVEMVKGPVTLMYMGNDFPIEMPVCPQCGQYFIPEELALGKILQVERALEDK